MLLFCKSEISKLLHHHSIVSCQTKALISSKIFIHFHKPLWHAFFIRCLVFGQDVRNWLVHLSELVRVITIFCKCHKPIIIKSKFMALKTYLNSTSAQFRPVQLELLFPQHFHDGLGTRPPAPPPSTAAGEFWAEFDSKISSDKLPWLN